MKKLQITNYKLQIILLVLICNLQFVICNYVYSEGFKIEPVKTRIITPNDDNKNDMLIVFYLTDYYSSISGRILTIDGSYVADMIDNTGISLLGSDGAMTWNGKESISATESVPSGIYIYQIETEGQVFNGTVVVAK